MNYLSSEIENINKAINYFDFIKIIFNNFIKYIKNYRLLTLEYIEKITEFKEKNNSKLQYFNDKDNTIFQNINANHINSIRKCITGIIDKQIENLDILAKGLETHLNEYVSIINENTILLTKFQLVFDVNKNDLLKKYSKIDELKNSFINSLENTEDVINKYLNKKEGTSSDDCKNSISFSKKKEKEYINEIKSTNCFEKIFNSTYETTIKNLTKLVGDFSKSLKCFICNFFVLLRDYNKKIFCESGVCVEEVDNINGVKIIEDNLEKILNKKSKLTYVKPDKYKLKIFQNKNISNDLNAGAIMYLEDEINKIPLIKNKNIFSVFRIMKENFSLIEDKNLNLRVEEEKMRCLDLTDKILSIEEIKENINNKNQPTDIEIEELNVLLDIHFIRVVFLQHLNQYKNKGKFELTQKTFDIFSRLFNTIINTTERDKDYHSIQYTILLSQAYYIKKNDGTKLFLQTAIKNNDIFKSKTFWTNLLQYSISKEIIEDTNRNEILSVKNEEIEDNKNNIAFVKIISYTDIMGDFGLDRETINEIISPLMNLYKIKNESIEDIKSFLNVEK